MITILRCGCFFKGRIFYRKCPEHLQPTRWFIDARDHSMNGQKVTMCSPRCSMVPVFSS